MEFSLTQQIAIEVYLFLYHVLVNVIVGYSTDHRFILFPFSLMKYEIDISQTLISSIHMTVASRKNSNNCIEMYFKIYFV